MLYGYIRVSTDKQTVENQRYEINQFCKKEHLKVDAWIEETVSGCIKIENRKLGSLLAKMKKGDILVCSEISRLGRNLMMIMSILNHCLNHEVQVWSIKDNYRLGQDLNSKVLAFAFGLTAEIERTLISQRTKEALARKKAEGIQLGRPKGSVSLNSRLIHNIHEIKKLILERKKLKEIAKLYQVNPRTLNRFIQRHPLQKSLY